MTTSTEYGYRRLRRILSTALTDPDKRTHYYHKARRQLLKAPQLRWLGHVVYERKRAQLDPNQETEHQYTLFLRNRSLMRALEHLVEECEHGAVLRLISVGCSTGAELYSAIWVIRTARPDLHVEAFGMDISEEAIATAQAGRYALESVAIQGEEESGQARGLSEDERDSIFTRDGKYLKVRPWIRNGVQWLCTDACTPDLAERVGQGDIVMANNMLYHMRDDRASACLSNILHLIEAGGYLLVDGINLDIKTRVLQQASYRPMPLLVEEIYHDPANKRLLRDWPFNACTREPMDRNQPDWLMRYAAVYQAPDA